MDTDGEREHEYFFILSFRDRIQCDRAVEHFASGDEPTDTRHEAVYRKITDGVPSRNRSPPTIRRQGARS
jgi:hypothetical protein